MKTKMNAHSEPSIQYANYFRSYVASILVAVFALSACGSHDEAGLTERGPSTAYDANGIKLGSVRLVNSCIDDAQPLLVRGLALLHHMTYEEAREAFSSAAEIDSDCAIAYWGSAMTYVHPLWPDTILSDSQIAGQALLDQARSAAHSSTREVAYIDALEAYYRTEGVERDRLAAFLDGWTRVREAYPDDVEGELFYALALLATASAADKTYTLQREAGAIAEAVKAEIPDHPGAHHYIIHAYDVPPLAEDALETAYDYDDVASENSHALHMTSHIFTRLGLWDESTTFNVRAADAAAERLPSGEISLHHMHALDYLAYAALQQVNDKQAVDVLDHLRSLEPPYQNHAATSYTFAAIPVRLSLERRDWEAAAELEPRWPQDVPWEQYPHLVAIVEFGRALGAAHTGDTNQAEASIAALGVLREAASALDAAYDWETQVAIQELSARAWLTFVQGDIATALDSMRMAAEMEAGTEKNPVTPGPVLPAQELYGDMLLETGDFAAARRAYEAALSQSPGRMLSLYGAGRAAELAGDLAVAGGFYRQLVENCPNPTVNLLQLEHAQAFLKADA
jgi:tetratricopeptide (TPR) repeat protein